MNDALLLTMMTPAPGSDAEFNEWANTEHIPERLKIKGFRTALRFRNKGNSPRYMTLYDLEDLAVLERPEYRAISGENLSPWTKRMVTPATDRRRFSGVRIASDFPEKHRVDGPVQEVLLILWRGVPHRDDAAVSRAIASSVLPIDGVTRARTFFSEASGTFDYVCVAECGSATSADAVDPGHYLAGGRPADFAQVFAPLDGDRAR